MWPRFDKFRYQRYRATCANSLKDKTMNVSLTVELEELVSKKVKTGLYQTASEVVLLQERDQLRDMRLKALRKEIAIGIKQANRGDVAQLDIDEILAESRRDLAKKKKKR